MLSIIILWFIIIIIYCCTGIWWKCSIWRWGGRWRRHPSAPSVLLCPAANWNVSEMFLNSFEDLNLLTSPRKRRGSTSSPCQFLPFWCRSCRVAAERRHSMSRYLGNQFKQLNWTKSHLIELYRKVTTELPVNFTIDVEYVEEHVSPRQFSGQRQRRQVQIVADDQQSPQLVSHIEHVLEFMQIYANLCKFMRICANLCEFMQIYANLCQWIWILLIHYYLCIIYYLFIT